MIALKNYCFKWKRNLLKSKKLLIKSYLLAVGKDLKKIRILLRFHRNSMQGLRMLILKFFSFYISVRQQEKSSISFISMRLLKSISLHKLIRLQGASKQQLQHNFQEIPVIIIIIIMMYLRGSFKKVSNCFSWHNEICFCMNFHFLFYVFFLKEWNLF